jgi:CubicO group peptidase (beta-lactamase class C family)/peptidoglycan/LPS O-acetylase OafA/YrhL
MSPPEAPPEHPARSIAGSRTRDAFVDCVRAFAIVRVVAWHTLEWPALSYIAAMPVMFFVGGTLARPSFEHRSVPRAIRQRLRRLLPPLWVYGVTAWALFLLANAVSVGTLIGDPVHLLWWIVPLWDPTGPDNAVAWWAPLWYLRAYLWLVLLTPVLRRAMRSVGAAATVAWLAAIAASIALLSTTDAAVPSQFEDLAVYGLFWGLGMALPELRIAFARLRRAGVGTFAVAFALAGAAWMIWQPVPLGIVNASPMAELLFGVAWVGALLCFAPAIRRVAARAWLRRPIATLNRRAVTIYLWHCGAIALAHELLDALDVDGPFAWVPLVALVGVGTSAFVLAAGPVEDLTAPRRPEARPPTPRRARLTPRSLVAAATVPCVLLAAAVVPQLDLRNAEGAYVPASGRGLDRLIDGEEAEPIEEPVDPLAQAALGPVTVAELETLFDEWNEEWGLTGVVVSIGRSDGSGWSAAAGTDDRTDLPMAPGQTIPAHSITKSFTGALLLQLQAEGVIDLDQTLDVWMPEFPHAAHITLRQLAQHRSGLADTGEAPAAAIELAASEPLSFEPGTDSRYSDTSYFLLGTVIERATGLRYEDVLRDRLLVPLGLTGTTLSEVDRWSAGGITTTAADLVRWSTIYWGGGLGEVVAAEAHEINADNNFGIGTFGFCPCTGHDDDYEAALYGHLSSQGRLSWDPIDDLAIMVHSNELNQGSHNITAWTRLDRQLRALVAYRPLPAAAPPAAVTPAAVTPVPAGS